MIRSAPKEDLYSYAMRICTNTPELQWNRVSNLYFLRELDTSNLAPKVSPLQQNQLFI